MITLYQFNLLDNNRKMVALTDGFYLKMRFEGEVRVMLYTLDGFYVEVYYNQIENQVISAAGFKSNGVLAKFIKL